MNWLTNGGNSPLNIDGTLEIVKGLIGGVLLTMNDDGQTINFPYGGIVPLQYRDRNIATDQVSK